MAAPGMAGHDGPVDSKLVEHRDCVGDVARHRQRAVERGWGRTALLISDPAIAARLVIQESHVVGEPGAAVQEEQWEALALLHAADVAAFRVRDEDMVGHGSRSYPVSNAARTATATLARSKRSTSVHMIRL